MFLSCPWLEAKLLIGLQQANYNLIKYPIRHVCKPNVITYIVEVRGVGFEPTNPYGTAASGLRLWPGLATPAFEVFR